MTLFRKHLAKPTETGPFGKMLCVGLLLVSLWAAPYAEAGALSEQLTIQEQQLQRVDGLLTRYGYQARARTSDPFMTLGLTPSVSRVTHISSASVSYPPNTMQTVQHLALAAAPLPLASMMGAGLLGMLALGQWIRRRRRMRLLFSE